MRCVNINHPEFKELLAQSDLDPISLAADVSIWQDRNNTDLFPTLEQLVPPVEKVEYRFAAVDKILAKLPILNKWWKDKSISKETFWKKFKELGIPAEQVELYQESNADTFEQVVVDTLAKYSFDVELNIAREKKNQTFGWRIDDEGEVISDINTPVQIWESEYSIKREQAIDQGVEIITSDDRRSESFILGGIEYFFTDTDYYKITKIPNFGEETSSYYKDLTVPGGTNYQELEIKTPNITPSIKGHAQFATDEGVGWFRSDDLETDKSVKRVLEMQSDLFQKGRNDKYLTNVDDKGVIKFSTDYADYTIEGETIKVKHENGFTESFTKRELVGREDEQEIRNAIESYKDRSQLNKTENKFLQLLNKDGNWIKFFIQSIVADSKKKGYKNVLFTAGETAAKIEGHDTLANELNRINKRIEELKKEKELPESEREFDLIEDEDGYPIDTTVRTNNEIDLEIQSWENRRQELKSQGLEKLKPIEGFYEVRVQNTLKKLYPDNVVRITDEYGNDWFSINLYDDRTGQVFFQKDKAPESKVNEAKLKSLLERTGFSLVTLQEYEKITGKTYDVNALVDMTARLVAIADAYFIEDKTKDSKSSILKRASIGSALTEELSHIAAYQMEGTMEFNTAIKLIDTYDKYEEYYEEYYPVYEKTLKEQLGRVPTKDEVEIHVKKEILGKAIKEDLEVKLGTSLGMWLRRLWNKFIKLFKNKDLYDYVSHITDQFITNPEKEIQGTGIFFQLKEEEKILQGQVNNLKDRLNKLKRRGKLSKETVAQIKALEEELEGNKNGVGIYKFLGLLNNDIQSSLEFLKDYFTISQSGKRTYLGIRSDKETPSSKIILQLSQFIGYYLPFLKELNNILDQEAVIGSGRKQVLDRLIRDQTEKFEVINRAYQQLLSEDALRTVTEAQEDIAGEQVIDPNELKHVYQDSNFLETWFAPIRNNTDNILRLVHRLVVDLNTKIKRNVNNWADGLMSQSIDYIGKDVSWLAELTTIVDEKTKKPKIVKSGYFLSEVKWAEFNKAREEFHFELHDKYQFSQNVTERYRQKAVIQEYKKKKFKDRSQFEKDEISRLQSYNEEIAKWYARNTVPIKDMDNYIATVKATLSPDQFEFWKNRNMELNEDGSVRYYKRDLVMPSQGKIKTINTPDGLKDIRTVDWSNPDYFKLSDKDREFLNYLKNQKKEIDKSIPFANSDLLPQMYESTLDIMSKMQPDLFKRLKRNIQTSITKNEDDTEFSDTINLGDGGILEDVPIRFTSLLSEPDRVSTDILSSMVAYKQMQENYVQKSSKLPMFENILQAVKRRKVSGKKETIAGEQSWSFTALKNFLQVHIAGKEKEDLNVKVLNTEINVTKLVEKLSNWVRAKNLGFNFITMTSNLISPKVFATVESLVGNYTTPQSSAFANKELFSNLKGVLTSFNGYKATDRISSLMTYFGLGRDIREQFDDMDKHVLMRGQPDKALMYGYHIGNYFLKSVVMIAVLDNYRVSDNKWYTKKEAEKVGLDFNSMTSAYNMLKTDSDGRVTTMIPESVINNITARINTISNRADGSLSSEDKAAIYQNAVFSMVGLHRGWLFEGLSRRLKSKGYDFTLNQVTEGEYRTVMDLIGRFFMSKEKIQVLKNLLAKYNELEDYQKENLKRVMLELSMIAAFTIIALTLNSGDDDEEDYLRDLLAYQSNRVLLEVSSFYNPNEFVSAIKDPIVPARDLELVTNFTDMFNTEVIERGKWEGLTKQQKYFLQLVPGIKGWSTLRDPNSQNQFLKNKPLKPVYSAYEFFTGGEEK